MHLHDLQCVLTLYFAKVTKLIKLLKLQLNKINFNILLTVHLNIFIY